MKALITAIVATFISAPNMVFAAFIAQYSFTGNAFNESGNDNHGTVFGATLTEDRFGNANSAYAFDGSGDYIDIAMPLPAELSPTDALSISVWVKADMYGNASNGIVAGVVAS